MAKNNNARSKSARSKSARSNNAKSSRSNNCSSARSSKAKNSNNALDNMKYEIAKEFGVNLGASSSARANGSVGGEMTKRLIEKGRNSKSRSNK